MTTPDQRAQGLRQERIHASTQFADGRFGNTYASTAPVVARGGITLSTLGEIFFGGAARKPVAALPVVDPLPAWHRPASSGLRVTWLGHSTMLLEIDGCRVLTDPVWGQRASPFAFAGPKRFQPVPVGIGSLPTLDAVLVSHDHYDHLDRASIRALAALDVPFVTSLGVGKHLQAWGVPVGRIVELDWWEEATLPCGLTITAAPSHHFSGRGLTDRNTTLWSSFALRGARHAVFFSGDTGLSTAFGEIGRRLGPFDLAAIEVGAFDPAWGDMHLGPDNALEAWKQLGAARLLPVHWGTFDLALHDWHQPAEVLLAKAPEGLVMPRLGEAIEPAQVDGVTPWWRAAVRRPDATRGPGRPAERTT